jgi:hypothetical protein
VRDERVVSDAPEATASGLRAQAAENPCDSMPNAVLARAVRFASPMTVVSSTRAAGRSAFSSRADSSSVTVGGV